MDDALTAASFREAAEELAAWWARRERAGPRWRWVAAPGVLPSQGGGYLELARAPCASNRAATGVCEEAGGRSAVDRGGSARAGPETGGAGIGGSARGEGRDGDGFGGGPGASAAVVAIGRLSAPRSPPSPLSARSSLPSPLSARSSPSSFPSSPSSAASLDFAPSSPDSARLSPVAVGPARSPVRADYVIAWSEPYECPVLFFLPLDSAGCPVLGAWGAGGGGGEASPLGAFAPALFGGGGAAEAPLPLFPPASLESVPGLRRPMFMVHPCRTHEVMAVLLGARRPAEEPEARGGSRAPPPCDLSPAGRVLLTWLRYVASPLPLTVPIQ